MALESVTTPEGLRVYVDPIPTAQTVKIDVHIGVGSIHEQPGEEGLAHVLEHAVHLGTEDFPTSQQIKDQAGTKSIARNANTAFHRTAHYGHGPYAEPIFHRLSQLLLKPTLEPKAIAQEMGTIEQKARRGLDNLAGMHVYASEYALYGAPYGRAIIGHAGMINFSAEQVRAFHERHYRLGNMAIVATGKTTMDSVLTYIDQYFDTSNHPLAEGVAAPKLITAPAQSTGYLKPDAASGYFTESAALDRQFVADYIENRAVYRMALHALSGRLLGTLRADRGLVYNASLSVTEYNHPDAWKLAADTSAAPKNIKLVTSLITDTLAIPAEDYPSTSIEAAIGIVKGTTLTSLDSLKDRSQVHMDRLRAHSEPFDLSDYANSVQAISVDEVMAAMERLRKYFNTQPKVGHFTGNALATAKASTFLNQADFS